MNPLKDSLGDTLAGSLTDESISEEESIIENIFCADLIASPSCGPYWDAEPALKAPRKIAMIASHIDLYAMGLSDPIFFSKMIAPK